jgi:3-hydroxyisobutyrate dehydrogenase-like beta-hydroxyacid dehydrogenase
VALVVAMLGLGEAGSEFRAGLRAAGARVVGYDPLAQTDPDVDDPQAAVAVADIVISVTTAAHAREAAESVLSALGPAQVYADANTSAAGLKRELAALIEPTGAAFADVAIMAPVPGRGLALPALASGPGAQAFVDALAPLGMRVAVSGSEPGDAAQRKLLRSVLWKGIAAAITEALSAARAAGEEAFMREQIAELFEEADPALARRMETGSVQHAYRRMHEMHDAEAMLDELGVQPRVARAAAGWLQELHDGR